MQGQWVFGAEERYSKRVFIFPVQNNKDTFAYNKKPGLGSV